MPKQFLKTKTMVLAAMFIALDIVITRFIAIQTPITRIGFGFIPVSMCGMLLGPWIGAVAGFLGDFLGMLINSRGMAYFPGFGLSAALYGLNYGLFLHGRKKGFKLIIPCVILSELIIGIGLGTLWLVMMTESSPTAILVSRIPQSLLLAPIKIFMIKLTWEYVGKYIERNVSYALHG